MSNNRPVFTTYRRRFEAELERYGFAKQSDGRWRGLVDVTWYDGDGTKQRVDEEIAIDLPSGFPFAKPRVTPISPDPVVADSIHREENGPACLWRDDVTGWHPGIDAGEVLDRTREWFVRCREGRWRADERPADLNLYYRDVNTQTIVAIGDDWKHPTDERRGRFGVWQTNELIAFAGDPGARHKSPQARHDNRMLQRLPVKDDKLAHVGIWFRVDREPPRLRDAAVLLAFLDAAGGTEPGVAAHHAINVVGAKIHGTKRLYIAIGYPGASAEEHWLFLRCDMTTREGKKWATSDALKTIRVDACVTAPADSESLMRRVGPVAGKVSGKQVAIFGVGAIGSEIALLLAKSGVPRIALADSDRLTPTNTVRHAVGLRYAGAPKTFAVEQEILDHAPGCTIQTHDTTWEPEVLAKVLSDADVVVDATAQPAFSFLLNELAIAAGKPVVHVAAHRRAGIGRIRLVRPYKDACLTCYEGSAGHVSKPGYPVIPELDGTTFVEEGCGTPTTEGAAIDLQLTANAAARMTLDELVGESRPENHVLVVVTPVSDARAPLDTRGIHEGVWPPIPGCESCGNKSETDACSAL